jgi:hypothetical protein
MATVSKLSDLIAKTMKFSVHKVIVLFGIMVLPTVMIANKSTYADPEHRSNVLPVSASASLSKTLTVSSLMFFKTGLDATGLPYDAFEKAIKGFSKLREKNLVSEDSVLTIVDFTKSSKEKRLYVIDLKNQDILFQTVVAHGRNSGQEYARSFSNKPSSNKSSLGFYVTQGTYMGSNGYSLKLQGTETGINDMALARAIVMHGADYANENVINNKGYLGRSFGCPALPQKLNKKIIDKIKNGNALFVYYPDPTYIKKSKLLNG